MDSSLSQRRRQRFVLLWSFAFFATSTLASPSSQSIFPEAKTTFPSVHYVTVDKQELQTPQYTQRVAEMDLVQIHCPDDKCRIQALIHSPNEMEHFRLHNVSFQFDADANADAHADAIEGETPRMLQLNATQLYTDHFSRIDGFSCFLDYQGTMDWLQDLVMNQNYSHVELQLLDIGDSYLKTTNAALGHDIIALKLSSPAAVVKSPMLILTGVHPREYTPPELVRQWVYSILDPNNLEMQSILYSTDIYWVPYVNPDGRVLAETTQIFRRKNLNKEAIGSASCAEDEYGVDLNRNFPFRWGRLDGSSDDPCLQTFHGSGPASEPEVQAIVQLGLEIFPEAQRLDSENFDLDNPVGYNQTTTTGVFLDIHSWGNLYIYPWGYENVATPNHDSFTAMATKLAYFTEYDVCGPGPCYTAAASGATDDWSYSTFGAAGMTWELGTSFHQDCMEFEKDIVTQNIIALTYAAKLARLPHMLSQGPDVINLQPNTQLLEYNETLTISFEASATVYLDKNFYSIPPDLDSVLLYIDEHPYGTEYVSDIVQPHWVLNEDELMVNSDGTLSVSWDWESLEGWLLTSRPVEGEHTFYFIAVDSRGFRGPLSAVAIAVAALPSEAPSVANSGTPTSAPSLFASNFSATTLAPSFNETSMLAETQPTTTPCNFRNSSSSSCGNMTQGTDNSVPPIAASSQGPRATEDPIDSLEASEEMIKKSCSDRPSTYTVNVFMLCFGLMGMVIG